MHEYCTCKWSNHPVVEKETSHLGSLMKVDVHRFSVHFFFNDKFISWNGYVLAIIGFPFYLLYLFWKSLNRNSQCTWHNVFKLIYGEHMNRLKNDRCFFYSLWLHNKLHPPAKKCVILTFRWKFYMFISDLFQYLKRHRENNGTQ